MALGSRKILPVIGIVWVATAALCAAALTATLIRYGALPTYLDHAEADTAILAWRVVSGAPLYPSPDSENFILTAYGPVLYLANALPLALFGGSIQASKVAGLAAIALTVIIFAWDANRRHGPTLAALGATVFIAVLLVSGPFALWIRPESLLLLLATVAVACMPKEGKSPGLGAAAIVGVCSGLAVAAKIHGFIYFAPIVLGVFFSRWRTAWPIMAGMGLLAALLPFAAPGISLVGFVSGLIGVVKARGVDWTSVAAVSKWSMIFIAPILTVLIAASLGRQVTRTTWIQCGILLLAVIINLYPASSAGAGWHHMLPFLPFSVGIFLRGIALFNTGSPIHFGLGALFVVAFSIISVMPQKRLWRSFAEADRHSGAAGDVIQAMDRFPGRTLGVGVGGNTPVSLTASYRPTFVRPIPVFAGSPYFISPVMAMEQKFSGKTFGEKKIAALRECRIAVWLIPAGELPFRMYNYFTGEFAFPPAVMTAFDENYRHEGKIGRFDVWVCGEKK